MKKITNCKGKIVDFLEFEELCKIYNFTPKTTKDLNRAQKAYNQYVTDVKNANPGAVGNAEAFIRRPNSMKWEKARPTQKGDKPDTRPIIDGKPRDVEGKTTGGRIDQIKDKYIIYTLHFKKPDGTYKDIAPRLVKTETFINKVYEFKAWKYVSHNGVVDGVAIQPSNRQLWAWLEDIEPYNHDKDYNSNEII